MPVVCAPALPRSFIETVGTAFGYSMGYIMDPRGEGQDNEEEDNE
jgi:hypothetical protein